MKDIPGYEGLYAVTEDGKVWSYPKRWHQGFFPTLKKNGNGYLKIGLSKNKEKISHYIHRLVAQTFISNPKRFPLLNHKNGIKTDNRVGNLEWCTQKENTAHAIKIGLFNQNGYANAQAKLTEKDVLFLRQQYQVGNLIFYRAAKIYGVQPTTIARAVRGERWGWLKDY